MKKIFAGLKSLNSTLNQLYLKKAPEEISDQHQKQRNIYRNLTLFKTIFNFNVYPRGCTDSNVKWYFSGPVNLEKKKKLTCVEESTACLSSPGQANFDFH